ncbi:YlxR family protein [Mycoplasmatota bacterium]|nr:YlxR family protein [Mycoplasmatota bacterium]
MKVRKIPMRKCVVSNERKEKKNLLRVVRTPEGNVIFDETGKANGRGVYLSKDKTIIEKARKHNILSKHLKVDVPVEVFDALLKAGNHG